MEIAKENLYVTLREQVNSAGLFEKQPLYYWFVGCLILSMIGLCFYFLGTVLDTRFRFFIVLPLAFALVQGGLWGHDLAHHQIFTSRRLYAAVGILWWNLFLGLSFGYWNYKHSRHHAHPNVIDADGDIRFPALWFSPLLTRGINMLQKKMLPHQKNYFLALLVFPYIIQVIRSLGYLARQRNKTAATEAIFFVLHHAAVWYFFLSSGPFLQSLFFLAWYYCLLGLYMGLIFSPNHYGMPVLSKNNALGFIRGQISTTRNITPGFFTDIFYGGLNYQIEHHLFPTMPRNNLKKACGPVRDFCRQNMIPYHETGTVQAFREILKQLAEVSNVPTAMHIIGDL